MNEERAEQIQMIRDLPAQLREKIAGFTQEQMMTAYIPHEWTIAQNIHHLADTHMICIRRFKLILTNPSFDFESYDVDKVAALPDARDADVEYSLKILEGLHARWAILMENLSDEEWEKTGNHPKIGLYPLTRLLQVYSNHGKNHLQQIQDVIDAMN